MLNIRIVSRHFRQRFFVKLCSVVLRFHSGSACLWRIANHACNPSPICNSPATGHPTQCAAACKVLEIMEREKLVERVQKLGPVLEAKLGALKEHPCVADVRGRGFFYAIEIVRDKQSLETFPAEEGITFKIMEATVARGVFTYFGGTGPVRDIINVAPPFIIDEDEMDEIVAALDEAITEVCTRAERAA